MYRTGGSPLCITGSPVCRTGSIVCKIGSFPYLGLVIVLYVGLDVVQ